MQELTVASVEPKGTGDKTFYVVKGTEGEDLTTFDAAAAGWGRGTKLNVEIKIKGKYTNIASWEMVSSMPVGDLPPTAAPASNGYGDDPAKRLSIERQSSAATILTYNAALITAGIEPAAPGHRALLEEAATKALAWLSSRFDDVTTIQTGDKLAQDIAAADFRTQADKDFANLGRDSRFKNVGELLMWCGEEGIDRAAFLTIVGVKDTVGLDVSEAYQKVKDYLAEKG